MDLGRWSWIRCRQLLQQEPPSNAPSDWRQQRDRNHIQLAGYCFTGDQACYSPSKDTGEYPPSGAMDMPAKHEPLAMALNTTHPG